MSTMPVTTDDDEKETTEVLNQTDRRDDDDKELYLARCHCGNMQGKFWCNKYTVNVWDCNCSDCIKRGNVYVIVPEEDFTLIKK